MAKAAVDWLKVKDEEDEDRRGGQWREIKESPLKPPCFTLLAVMRVVVVVVFMVVGRDRERRKRRSEERERIGKERRWRWMKVNRLEIKKR